MAKRWPSAHKTHFSVLSHLCSFLYSFCLLFCLYMTQSIIARTTFVTQLAWRSPTWFSCFTLAVPLLTSLFLTFTIRQKASVSPCHSWALPHSQRGSRKPGFPFTWLLSIIEQALLKLYGMPGFLSHIAPSVCNHAALGVWQNMNQHKVPKCTIQCKLTEGLTCMTTRKEEWKGCGCGGAISFLNRVHPFSVTLVVINQSRAGRPQQEEYLQTRAFIHSRNLDGAFNNGGGDARQHFHCGLCSIWLISKQQPQIETKYHNLLKTQCHFRRLKTPPSLAPFHG